MTMCSTEMSECEECGDEYDAVLDDFAKGPNGHCVPCRHDALADPDPPKAVAVVGERWFAKLDKDLKEQLDWHGARGVIAAQAFRIYVTAERATITYNGKERTFYRADFEDPGSGIDPDKEPSHPLFKQRREDFVAKHGIDA